MACGWRVGGAWVARGCVGGAWVAWRRGSAPRGWGCVACPLLHGTLRPRALGAAACLEAWRRHVRQGWECVVRGGRGRLRGAVRGCARFMRGCDGGPRAVGARSLEGTSRTKRRSHAAAACSSVTPERDLWRTRPREASWAGGIVWQWPRALTPSLVGVGWEAVPGCREGSAGGCGVGQRGLGILDCACRLSYDGVERASPSDRARSWHAAPGIVA